MAINISKKDLKERGFLPGHYTIRKIKDGYLIVCDHGGWVFLNKRELDLLESLNLNEDKDLFKLLEDKGIIVTESNLNRLTELYRNRYNFMTYGVSLHIVVVTQRCNHKCVYCHAKPKCASALEYDMSKDIAKKTVDFIFQSPSKVVIIEFQGGEPLLNFEVVKFIVEYAKEKNKVKKGDLQFRLVTNLQAMDDEKFEYIIENGINLCASFDGPKEVHNRQRIAEDSSFNSYSNIIKWLKKFKERKVNIGTLPVFTKWSLDHYKEIIDEYLRLGLCNIHIKAISSVSKGKRSYSAKEFIEGWKKAIDYIVELNLKGTYFRERGIFVLLIKILDEFDPNLVDIRSPCGACISQLAYNYDGTIYSCDEARMLENEVFMIGCIDQKYPDVVGSDCSCAIINASINDGCFCDNCSWKSYCGLCPVVNYMETNSLIPMTISNFKCKVFNAQFQYVFEKLLFDEGFKKVVKKWVN